ncbi:MAG: PLP-dependent aminotransferase family protein [Mangrovicoccus sp.]|nr:PLP-dependent aminotransferase family protein [Mangrovicoccus sp.]
MFALSLDRGAEASLQAQLCTALRDLLLSQGDFAGTRLPASRKLAQELSVSRMTVTAAYEQLQSEGYLLTRMGGGTYVAQDLPHLAPPAPRADRMPSQDRRQPWLPLSHGVADQNLFPHGQWARHLERAWRSPDAALLARPDPFGWYPLRAAIAEHLRLWRGLDCGPEQILITSGAREAFEIVFRGLLGGMGRSVMEDPGWSPMAGVLAASGSEVLPHRVDAAGLDACALPLDLSAAIVTPSRHYPTGRAMPLPRRIALLDWARSTGALIIEDDYDSEFRYQGQPLPALAGLDGLTQVLYLGSFSKLLSHTLRLGYLVLPVAHIAAARAYVNAVGPRASLIPQPALAGFMASGEFAIHLRRMRRVYGKRQKVLLDALMELDDLLELAPDPSGMHLCLPLRRKAAHALSDQEMVARAKAHGVVSKALSSYAVLPDPPQGLILGYAGFDEPLLRQAAKELIAALRPRL